MESLPIRLEGLGKRFGTSTAVDGLTLGVESGCVTALLGPNGAGKTTTLRMVLALIRPTTGRALINGRSYADLSAPRRTVGVVLGPDCFHPGRSGRNHLRVVARAAHLSDARVDEVLDLVELTGSGRRPGRRVLPRDAPTPRVGDCAARRSADPDRRRTRQRARSRRHRLAAHLASLDGSRGSHHSRIQSLARRSGANGRPSRRDQPGPAAVRRTARRACGLVDQPRPCCSRSRILAAHR